MKKKKVIIICLCIIVVIGIIVLINKDKEVLKSDEVANNTFAYMLETEVGSGEYKEASISKWPGENYEYNPNLSYCENGSELSFDSNTKSVKLNFSVTDKCYLYFDVSIEDVIIASNNINNIYNSSTPAQINCNGATSSYNSKYNRIEISRINYLNTTCTLTYASPSNKRYLNNYIIGLAGTTQGNGQVVDENGYRYEGKNPNNYIWFNNELWRIIGVFGSESHGQNGENLVKIIRNESIGGLAWNKSNNNNWSTSSLMNLLNGAYLNSQDGTGGEYCYEYSTTIPGNCDYRVMGINEVYRQMIKEVTWYLGGASTYSSSANTFYENERSNNVYGSNSTSWEGYIGLMYASDYGYSVLASSCTRTTNLSSYGNSACAGQSWLYKGYTWTITPYLSYSYGVVIYSYSGSVYYDYAYYSHSVHPVLYLNSDVYIKEGDGSINNPYIIGM